MRPQVVKLKAIKTVSGVTFQPYFTNCGSFKADTVDIPCEHNSKLRMYKTFTEVGNTGSTRKTAMSMTLQRQEMTFVMKISYILESSYERQNCMFFLRYTQ